MPDFDYIEWVVGEKPGDFHLIFNSETIASIWATDGGWESEAYWISESCCYEAEDRADLLSDVEEFLYCCADENDSIKKRRLAKSLIVWYEDKD